jgi:hypothetical protein
VRCLSAKWTIWISILNTSETPDWRINDQWHVNSPERPNRIYSPSQHLNLLSIKIIKHFITSTIQTKQSLASTHLIQAFWLTNNLLQ